MLRLTVTEHRRAHQTCGHCQTRQPAPFHAAVTNVAQAVAVYLRNYQLLPQARTSEIFADLFGQRLTPGTLGATPQACAAALTEVKMAIKGGVQAAAVTHFDETGLSVADQRQWLHVASTAHLTHSAPHTQRGPAAMRLTFCHIFGAAPSTMSGRLIGAPTVCTPLPITCVN